jgi:ribosomal protein S9
MTQGRCRTFAISPASASVGAIGGPGSFTVTVDDSRAWLPKSNAAWITISSPTSLQETTGTVNYTVAVNGAGSPARSGTIFVTGRTFTINQAAGVLE